MMADPLLFSALSPMIPPRPTNCITTSSDFMLWCSSPIGNGLAIAQNSHPVLCIKQLTWSPLWLHLHTCISHSFCLIFFQLFYSPSLLSLFLVISSQFTLLWSPLCFTAFALILTPLHHRQLLYAQQHVIIFVLHRASLIGFIPLPPATSAKTQYWSVHPVRAEGPIINQNMKKRS